jgi:hypothetical protein
VASQFVPLSNAEMSALSAVTQRLGRQLHASEMFLDQVVNPPVPGSAIDHAYAGKSRVEFDLAFLFVKAGEDHLRTILWITEARRLPSFAMYTVMRGAAEALARAWYLLGAATVEERRSRALNIRLSSLLEQSKLLDPRARKGKPKPKRSADEISRSESDRRRVRERLKALEDQAAAQGIGAIRDKNGRAIGFGSAPLPQKWELVADAMHEGEFAYGLVSGFGHSEPWALLRPERAVPTDDPEVMLSPTALNLDWLLAILERVLDVHDRILARWMELAGQSADVWNLAKQPS